MPQDVIVSKNHNSKGQFKELRSRSMIHDLILDIGEKTIQNIFKIIDESKTILWNGPPVISKLMSFQREVKKLLNKISDKY